MYEQLISVVMFIAGILLITFNKKLGKWDFERSKPGLNAYSKFLSNFKLGFLSTSEKYDITFRRSGMIFCGVILILWALGNLFGPITL